jgi:hypothetical protein
MLLGAGMFLIFCFGLPAQEAIKTTSIVLSVKDQSGAAVANAHVQIVPQPDNIGKNLTTDGDGKLSLGVPPGSYDLRVESSGFMTATKRIEAIAATPQVIEIVLKVGSCPPGPCLVVSNDVSVSFPAQSEAISRDWKVYVNRKYGFSFRYPPQYNPETKASNNRYKKFEHHLVTLTQIDPDIQILVALIDEPFDLQNLVRIGAPTGDEYPPAATQIGRYTFYWYGPGGGGVDYPDRYFVNLKGKTLLIDFYGPYSSESKTPAQETKDLEPQILATFQLLRQTQ